MANILKIYDFHLSHKVNGTNITLYKLAIEHPDLRRHLNEEEIENNSIQRQIVFDSFVRKLSNDLNTEVLKNEKTKRIIKRDMINTEDGFSFQDLNKDETNWNIYGILNGGKITKNAILEKVSEEEDLQYDKLDGDRIYDNFFFLLHLSTRCNLARLFIISKHDSTMVDSVFKKYLTSNLFKTTTFKKTKTSDYIALEYQREVLGRAIVKNITISKAGTIVTSEGGQEYQVEIKLKPVATNGFGRMTTAVVDNFRRAKVSIEDNETSEDNDEIKISINDPETRSTKTIIYGNQDNFLPKLLISDEDVLNAGGEFDIVNAKTICEGYINYDAQNQLM